MPIHIGNDANRPVQLFAKTFSTSTDPYTFATLSSSTWVACIIHFDIVGTNPNASRWANSSIWVCSRDSGDWTVTNSSTPVSLSSGTSSLSHSINNTSDVVSFILDRSAGTAMEFTVSAKVINGSYGQTTFSLS